jgi:hypothetical protein
MLRKLLHLPDKFTQSLLVLPLVNQLDQPFHFFRLELAWG